MATESQLVRAIRLEAPKLGCRLMRNNCGRLRDERGNFVQFGLAVGSSDLIGWKRGYYPSPVTPAYQARFVAVECKLPGKKPTREQAAFIAAVKAAGGIAGVVTNVDEFRALIASA